VIITIENFGAIKYFQFDTEKDLYLIFGKNSVGKSYAISLVYLILKNMADPIISPLYKIYFSNDTINNEIEKIYQDFYEDNIKEINISTYIEKHLTFYFNKILPEYINKSLINTFGNILDLENKISTEKLKITITVTNTREGFYSNTILSIVLGVNDKQNKSILEIISCHCNKKFFIKNVIFCKNLSLNEIDTNHYISFFSKEYNKEHFIRSHHDTVAKLVSMFFNESREKNRVVYYLPASRSGLYQALSAFGQIMAELVKNRHLISKPITLPAISEPVADYFLYLSTINTFKQSDNGFINYTNEIEQEILKGVVEFNDESKRIFFTPNETSLKLDLSSTSSMVSEISPIVSYLKYILYPDISKPIIFIEEPEAHLHPETQVKLMEVFAKMVKDNKIKLVMTSHSNYIFNKASNLVMDNKIDKEKFAAVLFEPTPEGSVAKILETDEYGIEDENFIDTAESIYEEKIELINKING
jgi:predicted ATPase